MAVYNIARVKARDSKFHFGIKITDKTNLEGYGLEDGPDGFMATLYFFNGREWEPYDFSEPFESLAEARASAREQLRRR